mgnify:CR=1 FL=1
MANEPRYEDADIQALPLRDLLMVVASYIEIGIDWNFEEAQVDDEGERWVYGRQLRDEIDRRVDAMPK